MSVANQVDNIVGIQSGDQVHRATGSGAMSETITVNRPTVILQVSLHLSTVGATAENFVAAIDSDSGTAYDATLISQNMNTVTTFVSTDKFYLQPGDDLDLTYTNTDASTWGLEVIYGDA